MPNSLFDVPDNEAIGKFVYRPFKPSLIGIVRGIVPHEPTYPGDVTRLLVVEFRGKDPVQLRGYEVKDYQGLIDEHLSTAKNHQTRLEAFKQELATKENRSLSRAEGPPPT